MAILFVANTAAELGGVMLAFPSRVSAPVNLSDPTSGYQDPLHDAGYSNEAAGMQVSRNDAYFGFAINTTPAAGDYWFHARVVPPSGSDDDGANGYWWAFKDANGDEVARLNLSGGVMLPQARGDAVADGASGVALPRYLPEFIDIKISVGANIDVDLYIGGSFMSSAQAANTGGKGGVAVMEAVHDDINTTFNPDSSSSWVFYSEVIVTDGESTVGWRLSSLEPDTAGFHTDLTGDLANLENANDGLTMAGDTDGDKASWNLTSNNIPAGVSGIRALVTTTKAKGGLTGPQNLQHLLRIGSTDYNSANVPLAFSGDFVVWDDNPATSVPWVTGDLSGVEQGVEVKA